MPVIFQIISFYKIIHNEYVKNAWDICIMQTIIRTERCDWSTGKYTLFSLHVATCVDKIANCLQKFIEIFFSYSFILGIFYTFLRNRENHIPVRNSGHKMYVHRV